jgi:hypothetical protein
VPVGVTGHRTQRPRGQVGPPGARPAQTSSSLAPGPSGVPCWVKIRLLASLIVDRAARSWSHIAHGTWPMICIWLQAGGEGPCVHVQCTTHVQ